MKDGRKPKRYGCALFGTYMIIVKAKKGKSYYEPRHWFPLRIFELENTEDSDGKRTSHNMGYQLTLTFFRLDDSCVETLQ